MNGALCDIGPVTSTPPSVGKRSSSARPTMFSTSAGWTAMINFGRPVLPPLVKIFQTGDTDGSITCDVGGRLSGTRSRFGRPPASTALTPTTSAGSASSMIAARSADGRRCEMGCGTAPSSQVAIMLSTNSIELGNPMVTVDPAPTPSPAK